jgi:hypothetical protein
MNDSARQRTGCEAKRPSRRCSSQQGSKQYRGRTRGGAFANQGASGGRHKPGSVSSGCIPCGTGLRWQPFIWAADCSARSSSQPGSLGAKLACLSARDPYSALLRVGFAMRALLPAPRCALTAPFHPCLCPCSRRIGVIGGLLSVALSLAPLAGHRRALPATLASWSPDFPRAYARGCLRPPDAAHIGTRVRFGKASSILGAGQQQLPHQRTDRRAR